MVTTYSKSKDQPGKGANPARGQLNREINISLPLLAPEKMVSRDGFGSPVPRQPAHLHAQAESGGYLLRDSSRFPWWRPFMCLNRHTTPSGQSRVHRVSHAITYRRRSLPRVRRHRASKFQGSSRRVSFLGDQLIRASLSHTWAC